MFFEMGQGSGVDAFDGPGKLLHELSVARKRQAHDAIGLGKIVEVVLPVGFVEVGTFLLDGFHELETKVAHHPERDR